MTTSPKTQKNRYDILQNSEGNILIMIDSYPGGPENPRVVYDGGDTILLYRSRESAVFLKNIQEDARKHIKSVDEVAIVEFDVEDEVAREYMAPMRLVKNLEAVVQ